MAEGKKYRLMIQCFAIDITREHKFGTDDLGSFYSVICDKKEPNIDSNSKMVGPAGIEPALYP